MNVFIHMTAVNIDFYLKTSYLCDLVTPRLFVLFYCDIAQFVLSLLNFISLLHKFNQCS